MIIIYGLIPIIKLNKKIVLEMITVTKLNNMSITINADLIEFIESTPDTIITTTTGKKILVKEKVDYIVAQIIDYRRRCFEKPGVVRHE